MLTHMKLHKIDPALIVIDMQKWIVSKGGSYDLLGMNIPPYQKVIPKFVI
jgi:ureidoacrylate peracid hydrolase